MVVFEGVLLMVFNYAANNICKDTEFLQFSLNLP